MANNHDARLAALRLQSLVATHSAAVLGTSSGTKVGTKLITIEFALGASGIEGSIGWVLLTKSARSGLGPALLWMNKNKLRSVNVVVDDAEVAAVLARRARLFELDVSIWSVRDNQLIAAVPASVGANLTAPSEHMKFAAMIEQSGADLVCEHGVLSGEVLGLEVCRVVDDVADADGDRAARIEIGVGAHDREMFQMVNGREATLESLAKVVTTVRAHRQLGAPKHPLNQLGAERLYREILIADPQLIGATNLKRAEPPVARENLKDPTPCVAIGDTVDNMNSRTVVVVCSAIVDTDLVTFAADARLRLAPNAELVLAVASNNVLPSMQQLVSALRKPARFAVVDQFRS